MCQGIAYRTLAKFNRKVEDVSATADTVIKPFVDDGIDFEGWCGISLANRGVIEEFTATRANIGRFMPEVLEVSINRNCFGLVSSHRAGVMK